MAGYEGGSARHLPRGETLTFGRERFFWEEAEPEPGDYAVGVWVEDLDGNVTEQYAAVTVQ